MASGNAWQNLGESSCPDQTIVLVTNFSITPCVQHVKGFFAINIKKVYNVKYKLITLIDITETNEHRGPNFKKTNQQANYNTVIQTLGLRTNIIPGPVNKRIHDITNMGFGSVYTGVAKYWEMTFETESTGHSIIYMIEDFHLVPVIVGLDETVKLDINIFDTMTDKGCNVKFEE